MRCGYWPCGWCRWQRDCVRKRAARRASWHALAAVAALLALGAFMGWIW